jgi:hypothetical protein
MMTAKSTGGDAAQTPAPATGNIYQRIPAIMRDVEAIEKTRENTQQHYAFRGIDDVYNAVHPIMAKHGVFMTCQVLNDRTEERTSRGGSALIYRVLNLRYRFTTEDGSCIETDVIGEGMDSGDKAANKAMSVGQKYAILQTFLIPTGDPKDPENDSPEVTPKNGGGKPSASSAVADDFLSSPSASGPEPWAHLADIKRAKDQIKKLTGSDNDYYDVLARHRANHADDVPVGDRPGLLDELREAYRIANAKAARR